MNQKGFLYLFTFIFIISLIDIAISVGISYYLNSKQTKNYPTPTAEATPTLAPTSTPTPTITPSPSPNVVLDSKTSWFKYNNPGMELEFPTDWKLTEVSRYGGPLAIVNLVSPDSKVIIEVSAEGWSNPYVGACGGGCKQPDRFSLTINGKKYAALQNTAGNNTEVFLLGPAFLSQGQLIIETTLSDLQKNLDTIQKILGTIVQHSASDN